MKALHLFFENVFLLRIAHITQRCQRLKVKLPLLLATVIN